MEMQEKKETTQSSQPRILFTGTGERMIDNVIQFIPPSYEILRCQPVDTEFYRAVKKMEPQAVIICLQSETREQLRVYDTLYEDEAYVNFPVLVIGYEEDCAQFRGRLPMKNLKIFARPVNSEALLAELEGCTAQAEVSAPKAEESKTGGRAQMEQNTVEQDFPAGWDTASDSGSLRESERNLVRKIEINARFFGRKNVLVVDDDVNMLNVIKQYLQDLYDVTVVPSGKLALKYIEKKPTDIVLLDYMMPEMDGPEVLKRIREDSALPNVPVVFLTGVSDKEAVLRGLEFRPNGYLLKPVARELLLEKVTEIVLGL